MLNTKILLVDKDKKFLKLAKKTILEITSDFQIKTCTSAEQALELLKEENYHAVISEYVLPEMNGLKFLSHLRKKGDDTPFIIFTSEGREKKVIEALNLGANYYIEKKEDSKKQFEMLIKEIEKQIEKKQVYKLLQLSNEKFQSIFSEAKSGIVLLDVKTGQIIDGNKEFQKQTGRSIEELRGLKIWDIRPLEKRELAQKNFKEISNMRRGGSSELDFLKPNGETIQISSISNFITVDNIKYIQCMTTNITEIKKFEDELREERNLVQKYLDIIDTMIIVIDTSGIVILANRKACEILGYKEKDIIGKNWFDNFIPEAIRETTQRAYQLVLKGDVTVDAYENLVLNKRGEERLISWHNSVLKDDQGEAIASISSGSDITLQRKIYSELIESEKRFRTLFEDIPIGIGISDLSGKVIRANKKMLEIIGYKDGLFKINIGNTFYDPGDQKKLREILTKNNFVINFETKLLRQDGTVYDALLNINRFQEDGEVYNLTFCQDISILKQLEEENIPLLAIINVIDDSILITDGKSEIVYVNPGFEKFTGYSYLDAVGQTPAIMRYINEEFNDDYYANVAKTTFSGKTWKGQIKIKRKDGEIRIGDRVITPIKDKSGKIVRFVGVTRDITDKVSAAKILRESQAHFKLMFDQAPLSYQSLNKEGIIIEVNDFWLKSLGYTKDEVLGNWFGDFLPPDFREKFKENFPKFIEHGEIHDIDFDLVTKDNKILQVFYDGIIHYNDKGEMLRSRCVFKEKKSIDESERRVITILERQILLHESANLGTWDWDIKTGNFIFNKPFVEMLGFSFDEIEPNIKSVRKIVHKDNSCVTDLILNLPKKELTKLIKVEHRAINKSGDIKWVQCIGKVVEQDKQGNPIRAIGLHLDITDKKISQLKIVESEIRYRQIFDHINEVFFITDEDGTLIDTNLEGESLYGYSRVQILKLNVVDLYANPEDRIRFKKAIEKQGFLKDFELEMKKKDGTIIDVLVNGSVRRDKNDKIIGYIGIIRDISKSKELEANILKIQEQFDEQTSKLVIDFQEKLEAILQASSFLESEPSARIKEQVNAISTIIKEFRKSAKRKID